MMRAVQGLLGMVALVGGPALGQSGYTLDKGESVDVRFWSEARETVEAADETIAGACGEGFRLIEPVGATHLTSLDDHLASMDPIMAQIDVIKEEYRGIGCGLRTLQYNLFAYVDAASGEAVVTSLGFVGETRTAAAYQRDYIPQIATAAGVLAADCAGPEPSFSIVDTRLGGAISAAEFTNRLVDSGDSAQISGNLIEAWREIWTLRTCAGDEDLTVSLGAYDNGGVYVILTLEADNSQP